jgi:ribosomal protein S19E (S16A)
MNPAKTPSPVPATPSYTADAKTKAPDIQTEWFDGRVLSTCRNLNASDKISLRNDSLLHGSDKQRDRFGTLLV